MKSNHINEEMEKIGRTEENVRGFNINNTTRTRISERRHQEPKQSMKEDIIKKKDNLKHEFKNIKEELQQDMGVLVTQQNEVD